MSEPVVGTFLLEAPIGEGGMGVVWRARHATQGEPVAIKVLSPELTEDQRFVRSFRDEVRAMARLSHPGIVPIYDHGLLDQAQAESLGLHRPAPWLAMAWMGGGTLETWRGALSWEQVQAILVGLLEALAHAHAHGVVHRDLKPANVLLATRTDPTVLSLTDFGVAHAFEEEGTISRAGTPDYMAPEQLYGTWREQGPWTDLYALGCLAWELVTGRTPWAGMSPGKALKARYRGELPSLSSERPIPPDLEGWLHRLLSPEVWDRPQRAADALWALEGLEAPTTAVALRVRSYQPPRAIALAGAPEDPPPWPGAWRDEPLPPPLPGAGLGLLGLREPPLCGRTRERDVLWTRMERATRERRAHLVVLEGPEGMGKSRLARWLCEEAHARAGAVVWRAHHGPTPDDGHGLGPMIARATHTLGLPYAEAEQAFTDLLDKQQAPEPTHAAALASWVDADGTPEDGPVLVRDARFEPISDLLHRIGRVRPVVLWLDDVPWGADALALARYLLEHDQPGRLLVVMTAESSALEARPMSRRQLVRLLALPRTEHLEIGPLPAVHHRALVESVVGLAGALVDELLVRTEGNPLFALQVLADYAERGLLVPEGGGYTLAQSEAPAPRDLRQVWTNRVDAVLAGRPPSEAMALELFAVLGGRVVQGLWRAAAAAHGGIDCSEELLQTLLNRRLLETGAGERLDFVHDALRAVLLERAGASWHVEELNRAAAVALAEAGANPERIARHWLAAGQPEPAIDPLTRAARRQIRAAEGERARELLVLRNQALRDAEVPPADRRWGEGWLTMARVARLEGNPEAAAPVLYELLAAARTHGWDDLLLQGLLQESWVLRWEGRLDEARSHLEVVVAAANSDALGSRARRELAETLLRQNELDAAAAVAREAWTRFRQARDAMELTRCEELLADIARRSGRWDEAEKRWRRARQLWGKQNNRLGQLTCALGHADVLRWTDNHQEADKAYSQALELASNDGARHRAQLGRLLLVQAGKRQSERVRNQLTLLLSSLEDSPDAEATGTARIALALELARALRWDEADRHIATAARMSAQPSEDAARLLARVGDLAHGAKRLDQARRYWKLSEQHWLGLGRTDEASTMASQLAETQ